MDFGCWSTNKSDKSAWGEMGNTVRTLFLFPFPKIHNSSIVGKLNLGEKKEAQSSVRKLFCKRVVDNESQGSTGVWQALCLKTLVIWAYLTHIIRSSISKIGNKNFRED